MYVLDNKAVVKFNKKKLCVFSFTFFIKRLKMLSQIIKLIITDLKNLWTITLSLYQLCKKIVPVAGFSLGASFKNSLIPL